MKYLCVTVFVFLVAFTSNSQTVSVVKQNKAVINLANVIDDRVKVELTPATIKAESTVFYFPRIIPGTYTSDNYGEFVTDLSAVSQSGQKLPVKRLDKNSWAISKADNLHKIVYYVNDTFDCEDKHNVFSPSGTNVVKDKSYLLNLHGFIGYFKENIQNPYVLSVVHTDNVSKATSKEKILGINPKLKTQQTDKIDTFYFKRYAELVDSPILYANQDIESFKVGDIEVLLSVYSPNKLHTAKSLLPAIKRMITAQKRFMGSINTTKKYSILLYLSERSENDASGFGALEHNNSTVVVMPEAYPKEALENQLIDIVAHEFFHIITPLTVHSEQIHNFDYNDPKMSEHLWMYEGTTEYFAQLFQVKEQLISKQEFFDRIVQKIQKSNQFDGMMSFTKMSKNILEAPYKDAYSNVYYKGALISMCLDILILKKSNGEKGILDVMKSLSDRYGANRPFLDEELIALFAAFSYPEVGTFLKDHVVGGKPINYADYFQYVGLEYGVASMPTNYFKDNDGISYLRFDKENNKIYFNSKVSKSSFFKKLGVQKNDILVAVNGKKYDANNIQYLIESSKKWIKGTPVVFLIHRDGKDFITETKIKNGPSSLQKTLIEIPETSLTKTQIRTRNTWLN